MENLKCVDKVVVASDFSPNVVDTLERIVKKDRRIMGNRPILFVNHANSVPETIAEAEICKELGVKLVFLKGKKTISSSKLKQ